MVNRLNTWLHGLAWLILSATAWACSSATDALGDGDEADTAQGKAITFSFNICTDDAGPAKSRALGVWEEDAANVAERILHIDDLRILLFDQSGRLLKAVRPTGLDYQGNPLDNDGYYHLSVAFSHEYFDEFDDNATVPFQVMILANLGGIGSDYLDYVPGETLVADVRDAFVLSPGYYPDENTGIPMYGIKSFNIPKEQLLQGTEEAPIAGEIDLIRSLCKIEVSDRIVNATTFPDGERYPRVTAVEMISWEDHGYIRPRHDNYAGGLKEANIHPAAASKATVTAKTVSEKLYRFYCPEANLADMRFRVTAILSPGAASRTFEVGLSDFSPAIGTELVRNHIYRFDVHAVNTIANLTVEVSDWNVVTHEFELDNVVSVEPGGFLQWDYDPANFAVSTETYNGNPEQQLSILNGTQTYATGTFQLNSPKGAKWKAYFIPGENGVDAFEFVDVDDEGNVVPGSEHVYEEGDVGDVATLHIRGRGVADSYHHWAELVVEVQAVDGNTLYAPLTPAMSSRYIIYRESKL